MGHCPGYKERLQPWLHLLLYCEERSKLCNAVPAAEFEERFVGYATLGVCVEEPFHHRGQFGEGNRRDQLTCQPLVLIRAPANHYLIAFRTAYFCAQKTNVADVMLCTRVRTACDVEIDRLLEFEPGIKQIGERDGMGLGIGGGKPTAAIAGACHSSSHHCAGSAIEAGGTNSCKRLIDPVAGDVWN